MNCVFCDIVNNRAAAEIVYEGDNVVAFLDIEPLNFGHTLIVPRLHHQDITTIPPQLLQEMMVVAQKVAAGLGSGLRSEAFNIISNNGRQAGQTVFHCHLHVIPRYQEDGLVYKKLFKTYQPGGFASVAGILRNELTKMGDRS